MNMKIGAVALTLIVAIPILLGYGLAFQEETVRGWQTDADTNLTDYILNHDSPYYVPSSAPANNSEIMVTNNYIGQGVTSTTIRAPYYNVTGTNYSSVPVYATATGSVNLPAVQTITTTGTNMGSYWQQSLAYTNVGWMRVDASELSQLNLVPGSSDLGYGWTFYGTGDGQFTTQYMNSTWKTGTFEVVSDRNPTWTIQTRGYVDMPTNVDWAASVGPGAVKLALSNGNTTYVPLTEDSNLQRIGSTTFVNGTAYSGVTKASVSVVYGNTSSTVSYTYTYASGTYADPSYGWNLSDFAGVTYPYWIDGASNEYALMLAHLEGSEWADLQPVPAGGYSLADVNKNIVQIRKDGSTIKVNGTNLGNYSDIAIEWGTTSVKVSGIQNWPTMTERPNMINSITVDYEVPLTEFTYVYLNGSKTIDYRVDLTNILGGTFPSSLNATLNPAQLYPGKSYAVSFNSIGVYGSSIAFAGETFDVNDGAIIVDGTKIRLNRAVFASIFDESTNTWINSINNIQVGNANAPSAIYFGGEWSAIIVGHSMTGTERNELRWEPGGWAFNGVDNDFALLGLLGCAATFVALAMYGRRSGEKVGKLMLICGFAGLIFLCMII